MSAVTILLLKPTDFRYRSQERVVGKAGDLFTIADGDRFRSEFGSRTDELLCLDDATAAELTALRDRTVEKARQEAEDARQRAEADADAERDRKAQREALEALVVAAAQDS